MIEKELFILLGTNLGDRIQNLNIAKIEIGKSIGQINVNSGIYETAAWGIKDQPNFLNQVLQISTDLRPLNVLKTILKIEKNMGRIREEKWGPRLIDIDILYFGNQKIDNENLKIPHPFLQKRKFTLMPLAEIAPNFIHPILKKNNLELLLECADNSEVILIEN